MSQKRSLTLHGHRTSISLEEPFWEALLEMAKSQDKSLASLVQELDAARIQHKPPMNLSSYLRVMILAWYRRRIQQCEVTVLKQT
jgi:predicted DNA-binding ribbon-helix-helix protein